MANIGISEGGVGTNFTRLLKKGERKRRQRARKYKKRTIIKLEIVQGTRQDQERPMQGPG